MAMNALAKANAKKNNYPGNATRFFGTKNYLIGQEACTYSLRDSVPPSPMPRTLASLRKEERRSRIFLVDNKNSDC